MPREGLRPGIVDASIAVVLFAGALLELVTSAPEGTPGVDLALAALTTLPLAWRSVAPVPTVAVAVAGFAFGRIAGSDTDELIVPTIAPLVAVYSVGNRSSAAGVAVGAAIALAGYIGSMLVAGALGLNDLIYALVGVAVALSVGGAVRVMGLESEMLEARAAELERERDAQAAAAVAAERARIARELHDVIGHSISVMGLHAGGVRRLLTPEQEEERRALLGIERLGRDAVAEMHQLLGLLRDDDDASSDAGPPSLRRVEELVADMRNAGLDVELDVEDGLAFDELSPGRAVAAYRILQEALTNALKHAPGAHVRASLRRAGGGLEIGVVDEGAPGGATAAPNGGHGLVGMRERVALYGGTLEAGPRDGRGFEVRARLPAGTA